MEQPEQHNWELNKCIWCGKPHVKYPISCAKAISKLVKRYKAEKPTWIRQLVNDANNYLDTFRINFRK